VRGIKPSLSITTPNMFGTPNTHFFLQWTLFYQTAELAADWRLAFNSAIAGEPGGVESLMVMIGQGEQLLQKHDEWLQNMPSDKRYILRDIDTSMLSPWIEQILSAGRSITQYHVYPNIHCQFRYRILWTCRLIMIQALLQTIYFLEQQVQDEALLSTWHQQRWGLEGKLVILIREMMQTCISSLICHEFTQSVINDVTEVPSWKGYQMFWPLSLSNQCLQQIILKTTTFGDELGLTSSLISFVQEQLGFEKAGAYMWLNAIGDPRPQLWLLNA
jgi:hypothetical protein